MRRLSTLASFSAAQWPAKASVRRASNATQAGSSSYKGKSNSSSSSTPRPIQAANQFTGVYLDAAWTRQFIVGTLLQRYDPFKAQKQQQSTSSTATRSVRVVEAALLDAQRVLSASWKVPVRPLDTLSEQRILRLLARYASGEGVLADEALCTIQEALQRLPGAPVNIADPVQMRSLLECMGYVEPGDNLHRVSYAGELHYPPQAHAFMLEHLEQARQGDGGDAFDAIRERRDGPAYAIDSATTSEVDDAIGVCVNPKTGARYFIVYVSDATVFCPYDSQLEQVTARRLTTTTYLPEGVFFMLPKPVVEAATLRDDRPCRTFNVIFQIDERTGELCNYSVAVGWLKQLRRITYDQVQSMFDLDEGRTPTLVKSAGKKETSEEETLAHPPPAWMTAADADHLRYILQCARVRLQVRLNRQQESAAAAAAATTSNQHQHHASEHHDATPPTAAKVDLNLPDPLVKVDGTTVLSVTDQVVSTQDARLAVAELMIAANEVCSRVAQAHHLPIPFRGTRALSSDHLVAQYFSEPAGVTTLTSLDTSHLFLAEAMQAAVRRLSTVTRAIYHHQPLHHAGLDTSHYAHSTSPLRRYADMLVHHQLKTWLWQQHRPPSSGSSVGTGGPQQYIPEFAMASLCAMISTKQEKSSLLQDSSTRFWILRYMEDLEKASSSSAEKQTGKKNHNAQQHSNNQRRTYLCLVGETRRVVGAPAYGRFHSSAADTSSLLAHSFAHSTVDHAQRVEQQGQVQQHCATVPLDESRWQQATPTFTYVSNIYLPEVQLAHVIHHHRSDVRVGAVLRCAVTKVQPTQGVLELEMVEVLGSGDERQYRRLWLSALVASLDA